MLKKNFLNRYFVSRCEDEKLNLMLSIARQNRLQWHQKTIFNAIEIRLLEVIYTDRESLASNWFQRYTQKGERKKEKNLRCT